jgi:hypothetical protein
MPASNDVLRYATQGKTRLAHHFPVPCGAGLVMYTYISKNCGLTPIIQQRSLGPLTPNHYWT